MAWSPARYLYSSRSPLTHLSRRYHAPLFRVLPAKELDSRTSCVTCQWPGQLCRRILELSPLRVAASQSAKLSSESASVARTRSRSTFRLRLWFGPPALSTVFFYDLGLGPFDRLSSRSHRRRTYSHTLRLRVPDCK